MFKFILLAMIALGLLASLVDVEGSQTMQLSVNTTKSTFGINETPIIIGEIQNADGVPITNANVIAGFPNGSVRTTTDSEGYFEIDSSSSMGAGVYSVSVMASKNGYETISTNVKIIVMSNPTEQFTAGIESTVNTISEGTKEIPKVVEKMPNTVTDSLTNNPVSKEILEKIEQFKKQQELRKELEKKQNSIEENRTIAKQNLERNLDSMRKSIAPKTPEQAFAKFVRNVDSTVQDIFWNQFKLTQQKHEEAKQAKMDALESGVSSEEAMKQFQRKASISRNQIIDHNEKLNIKYGKASDGIQAKFNDKGKIPRED